jgi:hypothetical protein
MIHAGSGLLMNEIRVQDSKTETYNGAFLDKRVLTTRGERDETARTENPAQVCRRGEAAAKKRLKR